MINPFTELIQIYTQNPEQTPSVLSLLFDLEKKYDSIIIDVNAAISSVDTKLIPINKKIANLELNQSNIYIVLQELQDQIDDILSESGTTIYDDDTPISSINIDSEPTEDSDNLVKSGGIYTALQSKQDTLTFDNSPTEDSNNPVKSGGVYTSLQGKQDTLTFDNSPTEDSNNPVKSGGVYTSLQGKQDTLTFDNSPTQNSDNPVKSGGVYNSLLTKFDIKSWIDGYTSDHTNNLDKLTASGIYAYANPSNIPSGFAGWGVCIIFAAGDYKAQVLIGNYGSPNVAVRTWDSGYNVWGSWRTI